MGKILQNGIVLSVFCAIILENKVKTQVTDATSESSFRFPKNINLDGTLMTRIVGGQEAVAHSYPFQVALNVYYGTTTYFCGGTIISTAWVLTAAHCVDGADSVKVVLGAHNLSLVETTQQTQTSYEMLVHENWSEDLLQNDIALIKLPEKLTLSDNIATIEVAEGTDLYENRTGIVTGWGLTASGSLSPVLRYLESPIMTNDDCAAIDPFQDVIVSSHICTTGIGFVGSCSGDSGGPLIVDGLQVGIVSFGYSSCTIGKPSVYTRLTEYTEWILENAIVDEETDDQNENDFSHKTYPFSVLVVLFLSAIISCSA